MKIDNLEGIFNRNIFRIPDYQRGYSWGESQLQDLWRDIKILGTDQHHYAGVLSVVPKKNKETQSEEIHVVDGQQRLATLIILIRVICSSKQLSDQDWFCRREKNDIVKKYLHVKTGKEGEITEVIFGYEKDNPSHIYFKTQILGLDDTDRSVPKQTLYTLNLSRAKQFFAGKIRDMTVEDLEVLFTKVTENLKFNYYQLDSEISEFIAFEVMNNRGKPLSDLELLKNRLIYLSTLLPDNDKDERQHLRNVINDVWKTVYEFLGKNPEHALPDDDFLRDHWIMNFTYSRQESKVYKEFLLDQRFTAQNVTEGNLQLSDIRKYAEDMQDVVEHYYYMHNPYDSGCPYSDMVKFWLSKLNRLGFRAFKPLVASTLTKQTNQSKILAVLQNAERFIFVAANVQFRQSNKSDSRIYGLAQQFHQNPSALSVGELSLHKLDVSNHFEKQSFFEAVKKKNSKELFYRWNGLRYFLYEYELDLQEDKKQKVSWDQVNQETIEHVYPQTPQENWPDFASEDAKNCLHNLGNLLLLSRKMNSSLKNKSFAVKKEKFSEDSYSAIKVSKNDCWTPQTVKAHEEQLLAFLVKRWELADVGDLDLDGV